MKIFLVIVAVFFATVVTTFADKPMWPRQPKISAAYNSLIIALKQIERSRTGDSAKHLTNASVELLEAKMQLETAKKNKGSARLVAIEQIDLAKTELDANRLDEASTAITKAIEEVTKAARAGR